MNKAYAFGWVAILLILFGYELYALWFGKGQDWPLTWLTVKYAPWWAVMPFLTWLWVHFAMRYMEGASYLAKIQASK